MKKINNMGRLQTTPVALRITLHVYGKQAPIIVKRYNSEIGLFIGAEMFMMLFALLLGSGFFSIYERKVLAELQRRWGPNRVGFGGMLQPLSDGFKLIFKEIVIPYKVINKWLFFGAPIMGSLVVGLCWLMTPFGTEEATVVQSEFGILYFIYFLGLGLYPVILGGWSANSSYPILGAARAGAQFISYELAGTFSLIAVAVGVTSFSFAQIMQIQETIWLILPMVPIFLIALISSIAETNRPPFDLPEAESELVAGYQTEHSGFLFASFVIMEHALLIQSAYIISIIFLGGVDLFLIQGSIILVGKVFFVLTLLIIIRAIMPRYRYDQLINIGWKILLPISVSGLLLIIMGSEELIIGDVLVFFNFIKKPEEVLVNPTQSKVITAKILTRCTFGKAGLLLRKNEKLVFDSPEENTKLTLGYQQLRKDAKNGNRILWSRSKWREAPQKGWFETYAPIDQEITLLFGNEKKKTNTNYLELVTLITNETDENRARKIMRDYTSGGITILMRPNQQYWHKIWMSRRFYIVGYISRSFRYIPVKDIKLIKSMSEITRYDADFFELIKIKKRTTEDVCFFPMPNFSISKIK